jgi:hypothetical protein
MSLYIVKDGDRFVWLAALLAEDIYTYVPNTGKFHLNSGLRHDYFVERRLQYEEVTVVRAQAAIDKGMEPLDEKLMADHLRRWQVDPAPLDPEHVFAAVVADLR